MWFDAHAHLTSSPSHDLGVQSWIVPGVDGAADGGAIALQGDPRVHRAVGLHPWHLPPDLDRALAELESRARLPGVIAIGETGLDSARRAGPREAQERAFGAQIALAIERDVPLILHVVRRHGACLARLRELAYPADLGGMVHDFGGPREVIAEWAHAGFALSISPRSLQRDGALRPERIEVVRQIPRDLLLVETDDFGVARLGEVIQAVAGALGEPPEAVGALTARNARRVFGLPDTHTARP